MVDISPSNLAALAKQHLDLPALTPDAHVPYYYIEELRRHLVLCPQEHEYRVTLQPQVGYGSVTCLKGGCNAVVPLGRRVRASDGGKSDGMGTLSAYRRHLTSHATKGMSVKSEPSNVVLESDLKSELVLAHQPSLATSSALLSTSSDLSPPVAIFARKTESSPNRIKPEALEARIPRKRLSDIAFGPQSQNHDYNTFLPLTPKKRVKSEVIRKAPLSQVTNTPSASSSHAVASMHSPNNLFYDRHDPHLMLEQIRTTVSIQRNLLLRLKSQSRLSLEEIQNITTYEAELRRLLALEQECVADLMPFSQVKPLVKAEPSESRFPLVAARARHSLGRASMTPKSDPASMDVDIKPIVQRVESAYPANSPKTLSMRQSTPQRTPAPFPMKFEPNVEERKPFAPINAVASGSKAPLPYYQHKVHPIADPYMNDSDASESDDGDNFQQNLDHLANPFVEQLGINVPPIYNDAHDDNGDYYGRGRDLFVGPQAAHDDIEKFLVEAGNAENFDGNESVDKASKYLGLNNFQDKLPGMEISLMAHQVMGVAWMLEKERSVLRGGCLADEMGLGKTVQMIACMLQNRSKDPLCKTTLILAPMALLEQWKQEIESKTNCGLKCLIYHGSTKTKKKSELLKYDVVLTTFHTMSHEWPDYENEMKKKAKAKKRGDAFIVSDSDDDDMRDHAYRANKRKQTAGPLFQIKFYRAIADEGQNIRNRRTRMSRAITDIEATYRWCLTGTPIVNTLADVYGLVRFIKLRPWYDWDHFQSKIGLLEKKNPGLAVARLQKVMTLFLLRRKKDSKLDGKNLIELPEKKIELVRLEFSEEERDIYKMVEARNQATFNRYLRAGTVLKNYHQVLVLLLRLRQICSHPSLIQEDGVTFVHPDEAYVKPEFSTELTRARRVVSPEFVIKIKEKFLQDALTRMAAEKQSANATIEEEDCPVCFDAMTDAVITACSHIFCRECIVDVLHQPLVDGGDHGCEPDQRPCPVCRSPISATALFSRQAFEPSEKELNPSAQTDEEEADEFMSDSDDDYTNALRGKDRALNQPRRSSGSARRAVIGSDDDEGDDFTESASEEEKDDDDDMSDFIVEDDEDEEEKDARRALKNRLAKKRINVILDSDDELDTPEVKEVIFGVRKKVPGAPKEKIKLMSRFLPSSKMKYMMDQLQKLVKTHPDEKTLIVSQWTGCLSLISDYLTEKGIPHVKYQGDMTRAKRDQAVQVFMSKEKARVMLMSLKCGGVGLNLTRANNVISLDLGWSQAVESQAFDRVHRVGQAREVLVQRVVIADTVEDRILQMQERKQTLADGSLGEGSGKKIGKLSVKELANLFGLDGNGRLLKA